MIVIAVVAAVFLAAAAGMALVRIVRGPSTLDRIVATDVLLAITVCAIATEAAYSRDATGLPILLGLSLLGAVGSIAVARFADPAAKRATDPAVSAFMPATDPALQDAPGGDTHDRHAAAPEPARTDVAAPEPARTDAAVPPLPVPVDSGLGDATAADPDDSPAPEPGATPVTGISSEPDEVLSAGRNHHSANGDRS
ncbi:MAG TPA: monovalent cation/H+ antiporter complex subunit F [Actinoplanes sp.]|nr:monovalent cation/H+ antiporter complex subunit F [Actinoplanes sp.]